MKRFSGFIIPYHQIRARVLLSEPLHSARLFIFIFFMALWMQGCHNGDAPARNIRAHDSTMQGIMHADPMIRAERYCSNCHGTNLTGGSNNAAPSCYQCHGKNWLDDSSESYAPADHTALGGVYHHHPNREAPSATCVECHGAQLQGVPNLGRPGCQLCHGEIWAE